MTNLLGDLISKGEGGYNSYNRGTKNHRIVPAAHPVDFSNMTLAELQRRQRLPKSDPDRIFAAGKYQLIPSTLNEAVQHLKINGAERYTPELQERIFADHLIREKRPEVFKYIVGDPGISLRAAQKAISNEWASVEDPDTPGRPAKGYYDAGNRSSTSAASVANALDHMRKSYAADIAREISPDNAWRTVTGQLRVADLHRDMHSDIKKQQEEGLNLHDQAREAPERQTSARLGLVQASLRQLGYLDSKGAPLSIDNHLGPNTLHAIKSFQRAHHLHIDGIVGKHTLAALEDAQRWPLLSEATHPQHRLYSQIERGIRKLPSHGRSADREIENAAVALTIAAHSGGLHRVDHVVLGSNGINLFAVQGRMEDPAHRRVHVELAHAVAHAGDHRAIAAMQPTPEHLHAMAVAQHQSAPRPPVMTAP